MLFPELLGVLGGPFNFLEVRQLVRDSCCRRCERMGRFSR